MKTDGHAVTITIECAKSKKRAREGVKVKKGLKLLLRQNHNKRNTQRTGEGTILKKNKTQDRHTKSNTNIYCNCKEYALERRQEMKHNKIYKK